MRSRCDTCTPEWTCKRLSDPINGYERFRHPLHQVSYPGQCSGTGGVAGLGCMGSSIGSEPSKFCHSDDGDTGADFFDADYAGDAVAENYGLELADFFAANIWALRILLRLRAFLDILRARQVVQRVAHADGDGQTQVPDHRERRSAGDGATGCDKHQCDD